MKEPSYNAGRNVNWYSHYGEQYGVTKLKIEQPYDPAIPILGINPEKIMIQKQTCTPRRGSNLNVHQQRTGYVVHKHNEILLSH